MLPSKIAFVDIETTGTSFYRDRIIEVGVLRVENNKLVDTYKTLVNPETHLPEQITAITGITTNNLDSAPTFSGVRKHLEAILGNCVFAAHNARFDYGFIKTEFRRDGSLFKAKNLCTVKLSRNLFPEYPRHGLDMLIERFGFAVAKRHRAFDDAEVLWKFYQLMQKTIPKARFAETVAKVLKKPSLPIGLSEETLDNLPESPGVYIFYGEQGMPLYVGKSINVHDRVMSHFSNDTRIGKEMKLSQQARSIEVVETAGELGALFKESQLIKDLQPLYNRQLRFARKLTVLLPKAGKYNSLSVEEVDQIANPSEILGIFKSPLQAKQFLITICKDHHLCEKILGLEKGSGACFAYRLGKCAGACIDQEKPVLYNGRFTIAFTKSKLRRWPFDGPIAIKEANLDSTERHIIDNWCYLGTQKNDTDEISTEIKFDLDTYKILSRYFNSTQKTVNLTHFQPKFTDIDS